MRKLLEMTLIDCRLFLIALTVMLLGNPIHLEATRVRCPHCKVYQTGRKICGHCLRNVGWPVVPPRIRSALVVVREGHDVFIQSPDDRLPDQRPDETRLWFDHGAIGTHAALTGLRYLVKFDIPKAFEQAGIDMTSFVPARATMILRPKLKPETYDDIPIIVYPLIRPFDASRSGFSAFRNPCNWLFSTTGIAWHKHGGDYFALLSARGAIPAAGTADVEIDITEIISQLFENYRQTLNWTDHGFIVMRDPTSPKRVSYRMIHGFLASRNRDTFPAPTSRVLSPELYIE